MSNRSRLSRSCTPLIVVTAVAAAVIIGLPAHTPRAAVVSPAPVLSEAMVEAELRSGCQHLVGLIESGSPHADWAVGRLRAAVAAPALGDAVHAMAHRGLAVAYRTGRGVAVDPAAAATHAAQGGGEALPEEPRVARR